MQFRKYLFKKTFFLLACGSVMVLFLFFSFFYKGDLLNFLENKKSSEKGEPLTMEELKDNKQLQTTAKAAGGLPWQFGGTVIIYQPACVISNITGNCPFTCPMCSTMVGQACNGYEEIQYKPAMGSMPSIPPGTVCAPKGFQYKGGVPVPGGQILGGGASPQLPWVIGVSSP